MATLRTSRAARAVLAAFALALLIPALGIFGQDTRTLQLFHNRYLRPWPAGAQFVADPAAYFTAAKAWLGDRVFPIVAASALLKRIQFHALHTPPQRRVTLGDDGFVFLNGGSDATVYGLLEGACVHAHTLPLAQELSRALARLAHYGQARGVSVDVVVLPTLATVYGDKLPESVPAPLRAACLRRTQGDSPLLHVAAPDGVRYVYPLRPMLAARDDPAFYPRANYHPVGLSLATARNAYLAALGRTATTAETLTRALAPSELMTTYGIDLPTPVYRLSNTTVVRDRERGNAWSANVADLFQGATPQSRLYVNSGAPSPESVLMLSDSFGNTASEAFAGAFALLFQIDTNDIAGRPAELVARLSRAQQFDRVIFLVQEGNVPRVIAWAGALDGTRAATRPPTRRRGAAPAPVSIKVARK